MKSATNLKNLHQRIETLKSQQKLAWIEWHRLSDIDNRTKEEGKELSKTFSFITKLNYQIRGLELDFKDLKEVVINEIIS